MHLQCRAQHLQEAIYHTQPITTKNASLPILAGLLFTVTQEGVIVRSTNLSMGVEYTFPAKIINEGVFVCSGSLLGDVVAGVAPEDIVTLEISGTMLHIATSHTQSTIKTLSSDDFPILPRIEGGFSFTMAAQDFVTAIKSVSYAASSSDIKPEISSVYMYSDGDSLVCVATDSFRLAEKKTLIPSLPELPESMIPVKNIIPLIRSCGDFGTGTLTITISPTQITFATKNWYCVSRLVDGQYPDYRQIIPTNPTTEMVVLRQDMTQALRILNIFADKFQQVDIAINTTESTCRMTAENTELGTTTTQLPSALTGVSIETRCNGRYIQECLSSMYADSIRMSFVAPNRPLVVRPVGSDDFLYLVMPIHRS